MRPPLPRPCLSSCHVAADGASSLAPPVPRWRASPDPPENILSPGASLGRRISPFHFRVRMGTDPKA
eukprot:scaffold324_cov326-Pavlova_lutheri.AAC.10